MREILQFNLIPRDFWSLIQSDNCTTSGTVSSKLFHNVFKKTGFSFHCEANIIFGGFHEPEKLLAKIMVKKELFVFSGPTNLTSIRPIQHSACQKDVSGMEKNTQAYFFYFLLSDYSFSGPTLQGRSSDCKQPFLSPKIKILIIDLLFEFKDAPKSKCVWRDKNFTYPT